MVLAITEKQTVLNMLTSELNTDFTTLEIESDKEKVEGNGLSSNITDAIEISDTAKAFNKIDDFLNLGNPDRLNTGDMSPGVKEEFIKILAILIKRGVVGYEILEVDGKPEKHFIVNQIGDDRLYDAKLYVDDKYKPF